MPDTLTTLPAMLCRGWGVIGSPTQGRALGPHCVQLLCAACHAPIKTVPKGLLVGQAQGSLSWPHRRGE